MSSPTYHDSTIANSGAVTVTTLTVARPTVSDMDWVYVSVNQKTGTTVTSVPSGFSYVHGVSQTSATTYVYRKYVAVAASEPATYQFNFGALCRAGLVAVSISGLAATDHLVSVNPQTTGFVSNLGVERIFTRATTGLSLQFYCTSGGNVSATATGSYSHPETAQTGTSSGPDIRYGVMYKTITNAIPASINHTLSTPRNNHSLHLLLRSSDEEMPFCVRSWASNSSATGSVSATLPALWGEDDLMLYFVCQMTATNPTLNIPAGFVQVGSTMHHTSGVTDLSQAVVSRLADASDTAPTFTWTGSPNSSIVTVYAISKGNQLNIAYASLADTTGNSTYDIPALTLAATIEETWVFASVALSRDASTPPPSGYYINPGAVTQSNTQTMGTFFRGNTAANPPATTSTPSSNTANSIGWHVGVYFAPPTRTLPADAYLLAGEVLFGEGLRKGGTTAPITLEAERYIYLNGGDSVSVRTVVINGSTFRIVGNPTYASTYVSIEKVGSLPP